MIRIAAYYNDIRVRERIEIVLKSLLLKQFNALQDFTVVISQIDEQFQSLLIPDIALTDKSYWWEQGVLNRAGKEYREDIYNMYSIKIEE